MTLDDAIKDAASKEGAYNADVANVANIEAAIDAAGSSLPAAKDQLSADAVAFNASLDALSQAALASKVTVPTQPAS